MKILDDEILEIIKNSMQTQSYNEIVEEFALDEETNQMKLVKRKVSEKIIPANADIIKMVYAEMKAREKDYEQMSEEELKREKKRLLLELKQAYEEGKRKIKKCDTKETTKGNTITIVQTEKPKRTRRNKTTE